MEHNKNNVIIYSGGLDSTVLLYYIINILKERDIHLLTFDYGQKNGEMERKCAAYHFQELSDMGFVKSWNVMNMTEYAEMVKRSKCSLTNSTINNTDLFKDKVPVAYVPNRNLTMLTYAATYCEIVGGKKVYYGAHNSDTEANFWDCTSQFVSNLNNLLGLNISNPISIEAPFINSNKDFILETGIKLGVDFTKTYTCYEGKEIPCGKCLSCIGRIESFKKIKERDPIVYAK